jgi:hypothetical protein
MLLETIRAYVGSVRFTTMIVTLITPVFAILAERTGFITPSEVIVWVAGIITTSASYIISQGLSDHGKEAAKINLQQSQAVMATAYADLEAAHLNQSVHAVADDDDT